MDDKKELNLNDLELVSGGNDPLYERRVRQYREAQRRMQEEMQQEIGQLHAQEGLDQEPQDGGATGGW